jgi:Tfp pilus assembly protein PilO
MMRRFIDALGGIDTRVVSGTMLLLIGLVAFESWMMVLRGPLAEYRQIRAAHRVLAAAVQQSPLQLDELGKVTSELKLLSDKLSGQLHIRASDDEMAASLMAALDQSAAPYGIELSSMKPGARRQVSVFEEVSFEVSGRGNYLQLCQWMLDFEKTLGNSATISEFDMRTADSDGHVILSFNIALYRPLQLLETNP